MSDTGLTPLLDADSPFDERTRTLVAQLQERETAHRQSMPVDTELNPERRRRVKITREEISGQPECITQTLSQQKETINAVARALAQRPPERVYLTGCGDSMAVMIAARPLLEEMFGVPCEPVQALDMAYYFSQPVNDRTLVVGLSSSGVTPRTVEAMVVAKALGARTLTLSNTADSILTREADWTLLIHAQRKGWPTQASTAALALMIALGLAFGTARGLPFERVAELRQALEATPEQIAQAITEHEATLKALAQAQRDKPMHLFCGGGPSYACAFFGAAKVKECTASHAMAIPLEEFHHYHSVKPGDLFFLIAPNGRSIPRARDTAFEAQRYGAALVVVTAEDNATFDSFTDHIIRLPAMIERLSSLVYTIPSQLYAYHLAMAKFAAAEAAG